MSLTVEDLESRCKVAIRLSISTRGAKYSVFRSALFSHREL